MPGLCCRLAPLVAGTLYNNTDQPYLAALRSMDYTIQRDLLHAVP